MAVYFVVDPSHELTKVGKSKDIPKRMVALQTGNPTALELMGWLDVHDDYALERALHLKFANKRKRGEWFQLSVDDVLAELQRHRGFIPKNADAFEIVGYDKDGIPEYLGVCIWADFEIEECCPFCGCFCGMYFNEPAQMYHCLNCDKLTDFSDQDRQEDD